MGFFRRERKEHEYALPPEPPEIPDSLVDDARAELEATKARDPEIDEERAKLLKIQRDNALGPRFWAAVGGRRIT